MEKILVTTDLSANSASAIQFAYKLSQLKGATLIIVHIYHFLRPSSWRAHRFETQHNLRKEYILNKLTKFLDRIFSHMDQPSINFEIDIQMSPNTVTSILNCAAKHKCTFICISTQGARKQKKIIGTSASKLIAKAPIPIFSVPSSYKMKTINSICYASDMLNYQKEIKKVIEFAVPLKIEIKILHIISTTETLPKSNLIESRLFKRTGVDIKVKYITRNTINSLAKDIDLAAKKIKPSIIVFFISRSKRYLDPILYSSNEQPLSIFEKLPILSFKK